MNCTQCNKEGFTTSYSKTAYCKKHFRALIEKRVRKDLRLSELDVTQRYNLIDDGSEQVKYIKELLESIYGGRLAIGEGIQILPTLLEEDVSEMFSSFLNRSFEKNSAVKPLRTVSVEDFNLLRGSTLDQKKYLHPLLYNLEKKQPGSIFAMRKTLTEIKNREIKK